MKKNFEYPRSQQVNKKKKKSKHVNHSMKKGKTK